MTSNAQTPSIIWTDGAGDNNWFNPNNWRPAPTPSPAPSPASSVTAVSASPDPTPTSSDTAVVNNGTTAQIAATGAVANTLDIGVPVNDPTGAPIPAVAGSTVQLLPGGDLAIGNTVVIGPEGTLRFSGGGSSGGLIHVNQIQDDGNILFDGPFAHSFTFVVTGTGTLTMAGTGTLTIESANTYTGGTIISAGTVQLGAGGTIGSITGNVLDNGTLAFDRSDTVTFSGVISGTGGVTQIGGGTTILTGSNTYSGSTTISSGTLQAGSATGFSPNSAFIVNATLDLNGFSNTIGSLAGSGTVLNNGGAPATLTVGNNNTNTTFAGVLANGTSVLQLTKSGTGVLTLTGANTYTGGTTISSGTLQLGNGGTTGSIAGNVTNNGVLAFDRSDSVTFGGVISGTGNVVQMGAGTLTLPGTNTYTGTTSVNAGSLIVNGSIASALTVVNPGGFLGGHGTIGGNLINNGTVGQINSPGTLTVLGNYTQTDGGVLRIGIAGVGQNDLLAVNGHATLGGALQLTRLGSFTLQPGNQITFLTAKNGVSGTFSNTQNGFVATGTIVQAQVIALAGSVVLEGTQGSFATTPGVVTTPNQAAVAKALDSAAGDPREAALFAFLNSQPLANLPHDLDLISPQQLGSFHATGTAQGNTQIASLSGRMAN
ncbi:MAG: autotransporter-associated beta strand repeat-containing protein, partial [Verrucomicrobia bacterium]|nr:autotransporter-associated beta strand repeat-containing protein [Verrucomicrobiota bacterium]